MRAGAYVSQPTGYRAFTPKPLPPDPPLKMDPDLQVLLSRADRSLGRLDGATQFLPNPDLFVAMYVRKEAVLSSQIEGTQASLVDVLEYEADIARAGRQSDVQEVVNYVRAMNYGFKRLETLPLSLRLIREIHKELLTGTRGSNRERGEFRRSQNWVGPAGSTLATATYVPPPHEEAKKAMNALETFLHDERPMPLLIKCGLAHAQFESIHPFLDGNGRVGRLLITFFLCWRGALRRPLLYLSHYFKERRTEYYDRLQAVRDRGDWEGWIRFFLTGIESVSEQATETARKIQTLREGHRQLIGKHFTGTSNGFVLLERLFEHPIVNVNQVAEAIGSTYPTANNLVSELERIGILTEITGGQRNRVFEYQPYLDLLKDR